MNGDLSIAAQPMPLNLAPSARGQSSGPTQPSTRDIVVRLNEEVNKALKAPEVRASLAKLGADPSGSTPEQLRAFIASETARWAKVVKTSGAKVD